MTEDEEYSAPPTVFRSETAHCLMCWKYVKVRRFAIIEGLERAEFSRHGPRDNPCPTSGRSVESVALRAKYGALRTLLPQHHFVARRPSKTRCWCGLSIDHDSGWWACGKKVHL